MASQVIILREFIFVFYGNELIIGVFLMLWMVFSGIGAYFKRWIFKKNEVFYISFVHLFFTIVPILSVWGLVELKNFFFPDGAILNFSKLIIICAIVLFPVSFISGFLFVSYSELISLKKNRNNIALTYVYDTIGSILGGIIVSFVFAYIGLTFQQLIVVSLLCLFALIYVWMKNKFLILHALGFLTLTGLLVLLMTENLDYNYLSQVYSKQKIVKVKNTPYGKLVITELNGQQNIYENNQLLHTEKDIVNSEESVHYCMLQKNYPRKVLVLSGGLLSQLNEILKYDSVEIDYVDINPGVIEWINKDIIHKYNNLNLIHSDARRYIRNARKKYDIVLINVNEPSTAQMNRFFTVDFYSELKKCLTKSGYISFPLTSENNYVSDENAELLEISYNTLKSVFKNVDIIPGQKNYFLASDSVIEPNIVKLYSYSYIENSYVTNLFLDSISMKIKQERIYSSFKGTCQVSQGCL